MKRLALLLALCCPCLLGVDPARPPNIFLIVIDNLRADRLGVYGNSRGLSPFLDTIAAEGTVFLNAYAQSSAVIPSLASLATGRFPSQHGVVSKQSILREREQTLAELLRVQDYDTAAFSANSQLGADQGFRQGFDSYASFPQRRRRGLAASPRRADFINRKALQWLDKRGPRLGSVFLYLHYVEPAAPYSPEPFAREQLWPAGGQPDWIALNRAVASVSGALEEPPGELLRQARDAYDAEVLSIDRSLQALFGQLAQRGFLKHAIFIVVGSCGQEFQEHGRFGSGATLYEELIHVPFIIVMPASRSGRRVEQVVSLVQLVPTLLEMTRAPIMPALEGLSLAGWLLPGGTPEPGPGVAFSELLRPAEDRSGGESARAVVVGRSKLIVAAGGEQEFYDLAADPEEKNPSALSPKQRAALLRIYQHHVKQAGR